MCRIAAYLGPPMRLSTVLNESPHSLMHQSRHARQMTDSNTAGDGWGVGWFCPEAGPSPGLHKSLLPLWSDENGKTTPRAILSGSFVGHIRYASENIETCFINTPLYVLGDRIWTINGELQPWPGPLSKAIRDRLDPDYEAGLRGTTDGEMLGAMWRTHVRHTEDQDAASALRSMLREVRDLAREYAGEVKMNLILASVTEILAVRYAEPGEANTLYYLEGEPRWRGGAVIASEPLDDGPGWHEVGPDSLLRANRQGVRLEPLDLDRDEVLLRPHLAV